MNFLRKFNSHQKESSKSGSRGSILLSNMQSIDGSRKASNVLIVDDLTEEITRIISTFFKKPNPIKARLCHRVI